MTINRGQGVPAAAPAVRQCRRIFPNDPAGPGVTHQDPAGSHVAVQPYPGRRLACAVTPYREGRCPVMPKYAPPDRS